MKALRLSKKQRDKLLEMCKVLFTKYNFEFYGHKDGHFSKANMLVGFLKTNDSDMYDNCNIFIHWFEFCMRQLPLEILYQLHKSKEYQVLPVYQITGSLQKYFTAILFLQFIPNQINKHPVDYLYKIFQKLPKVSEKLSYKKAAHKAEYNQRKHNRNKT